MHLTSYTTTLRRFAPSDLAAFQAYRNDPQIARYQSWEVMSDAEAAAFITHMATLTPLMRPGHWTQIAVAETATDQLIGDIGLHLSEDGKEAELGITLAASFHGTGHAARASALAMRYLFDETQIEHINAYADLRNTASRALAKRLGFTQTGVEETNGVKEAVMILHRRDTDKIPT